ncbi:extensin [Colletotrichum tofieldiae]|nr:extensin [Colletotrichum tofieldiae]
MSEIYSFATLPSQANPSHLDPRRRCPPVWMHTDPKTIARGNGEQPTSTLKTPFPSHLQPLRPHHSYLSPLSMNPPPPEAKSVHGASDDHPSLATQPSCAPRTPSPSARNSFVNGPFVPVSENTRPLSSEIPIHEAPPTRPRYPFTERPIHANSMASVFGPQDRLREGQYYKKPKSAREAPSKMGPPDDGR